MTGRDDGYWSIDIPGLTEAKAQALLKHANVTFGLTGTAADPARWLTTHMDADTVRAIVNALEIAGTATGDQVAAQAIRVAFDDWLKRDAP